MWPGACGCSNLDGGGARQLANGVRSAGSPDLFQTPIHVALTGAAYAFDRPSSTPGAATETVEVHSLDGRLMWSDQTQAPVRSVMLGGTRLAYLTASAPPAAVALDLWTSTAARPSAARVAQPASSASLSMDGSYLTWDLPSSGRPAAASPSAVAVEAMDSGQLGFLGTLTDPDSLPLRPAISSTGRGPVVAWFATAPGGTVYPAFRYVGSSSGAVISTFQQPIWLVLEGGTLIWVAENSDASSTVAFAMDVSNLGPG